ncbi:MAG: transposase [Caldilineaceae bacterium]
MPLKRVVQKKSGCLVPHELGRYACPLLCPETTGAVCPINHPNWQREGKEQGCLTALPTSVGARARHELDRTSEAYQRLYDPRSACERINSQAVALGIERPHLRNQQSITNQTTLIYVLINLRTYQRVKEKKAQMQRNC